MLFSCARPLGSERVEKSKLLNRNGSRQLKPLNLSGAKGLKIFFEMV
jgi:hypothetical protein